MQIHNEPERAPAPPASSPVRPDRYTCFAVDDLYTLPDLIESAEKLGLVWFVMRRSGKTLFYVFFDLLGFTAYITEQYLDPTAIKTE